MLTKDLLSYSLRSDRVYPGFLDDADSELLSLSQNLLDIFSKAQNQSTETVEEELESISFSKPKILAGFTKILWDLCELELPQAEIEKKRWSIFEVAQDLRIHQFFPSKEAFRSTLAQKFETTPEALTAELYQDLPSRRGITQIPPSSLSPQTLIWRYNCVLIQSLLIYAKKVTIEIPFLPLERKRGFFRNLRFSKLIAHVTKIDQGFDIELSGPLGVFEEISRYGMNFALFFPHCLHLPQFRFEAWLKMPRGEGTLVITEKTKLHSHYQDSTSYTPEEFQTLLTSIPEKYPEYQICLGNDFLDLGHQSYCFPDYQVIGPKNQIYHLEFFHPWHGKALVHRLKALDQMPKLEQLNLLIGVSDRLVKKDKEIETLISENAYFQSYGFRFRDFPTAKQVMSLIKILLV